MATLTKGSAILFLAALVCCVSGQGLVGQQRPQPNIVSPVAVSVNYPANFAVPIQFVSEGYNGPYDPLDPKGLVAASRRQAKITGQKNLDAVKSYIPPGLGKMMKKEFIGVAVNEGKRFAITHPKETAEIMGIASKAKALYDTASRRLRNFE